MASDANKKLNILYILDVLKEFSDEDNLLTQKDIINYVKKLYNVCIERKAVARNIDFLIDFGYDIVQSYKGYYLATRDFEPSEISFLIDSVLSSKYIPQKNANDLIKKLTNFLSKHKRKSFKNVYKMVEKSETNQNKQFFYSLDVLNGAIDKNLKVSFDYFSYKFENGKIVKHFKNHIVSPYFMINNSGKYYLVCNKDGYDGLANYKIENIVNISQLDDLATNILDVTKSLKFSPTEYAKEHIYMINANLVKAKILLLSDKAVSAIYEWFGLDSKIVYDGNDFYASVTASEQALVYWALQYSELVKIVEPISTKTKILDAIKNLNSIYNN